MICRVWKGRATPENAAAYESIVRGQVIPGIERMGIEGFLHIDLMRRDTATGSEFQTLMWLKDLEAVVDFGGLDYEATHVPAAAAAVLADYDRRAVHFEVLDRRPQPDTSGRDPSS